MRRALLVLVVAAGAGTAAAACVQPKEARHESPAPMSPSAAACEGCHREIGAEWRASFHRVAFSDGTFQSSLALESAEDRGFCIPCHAPAAKRASTDDGVDCTSCHARAHVRDAATSGQAVTRVTSTREDTSRACASCHEFTFDHGRAELVQKTVTEHAASRWAAVPCADCHAPRRDGHTDHRFVSGHAPGAMGRSVHVSAERSAPNGLRVELRVDAGHAFPTGDMFRRARLLIFAESADGRIVADAERVFGRTWGGLREGEHAGARTQESDTRIRDHWSDVFTFEDATAPIAKVRWTLLYERVVAVRGPHVSLVSSDDIASGELAW